MSRLVAQFNPAAGAVASFNAQTSNDYGKLIIRNESNAGIQFDLGLLAKQFIIGPWELRSIRYDRQITNVNYSVLYTLTSGSAPANVCYVEAMDRAEADATPDVWVALQRQTNVGNSVVSVGANTIQNDGNPAGITFVEATPEGASTSAVILRNDGSALFGANGLNIDTGGNLKLGAAAQLRTQADTKQQVGFGNLRGGTDSGITDDANAVSVGTGNGAGCFMKHNNYYDGAADRFITAGGGAACQFNVNATGPQLRFSTNTPAADAAITWGPWMQLFFGFYQNTQPAGGAGVPASALWINSGI